MHAFPVGAKTIACIEDIFLIICQSATKLEINLTQGKKPKENHRISKEKVPTHRRCLYFPKFCRNLINIFVVIISFYT